MSLRSARLFLSLAFAPLSQSAPPGLNTGSLGDPGAKLSASGPISASGPVTSAAGTLTSLPGAATVRGLSFDAHSTASGGASEGGQNAGSAPPNNNNGVGSFSTTRTRKSHSALEIEVRNIASQPDSARLEWFFVAKDEGSDSIYVWDHGQREVAVPAVGQAKEIVSSTDLTSSVTRTVTRTNSGTTANPLIRTTTTEKKSGARPNGWIVRMFVDGQLARVRASSGTLEQLGRNSAQLSGIVRKK